MAKPLTRKWNWDLYEAPGAQSTNDLEIEMSDSELTRLSELLDRAYPLIEQVNSMYNQYRFGVERRPPNERRMTLDNVVNSIQSMRKPNASARFAVKQIVAKYMAYRDRWDRLAAMMENGKDPFRDRREANLRRNRRSG